MCAVTAQRDEMEWSAEGVIQRGEAFYIVIFIKLQTEYYLRRSYPMCAE